MDDAEVNLQQQKKRLQEELQHEKERLKQWATA